MTYKSSIDGLRALAVLLVIVNHLSPNGLIPGGFVGVDVFFVISGYLITGILYDEVTKEGQLDFGNFYLRRLHRLAPGLIVIVALVLLFGALVMSADDYDRLARSAIFTITFFSNLFFYSEVDYFDVASVYKPLLHTWSLGVEEQFYLVWPILIWSGYKLLGKVGVAVVVAALIVVGLLFSALLQFGLIWEDANRTALSFYMLPFRFYELSSGALLALYHHGRGGQEKGSEAVYTILGAVGLAVICFSAVYFDDTFFYPGVWATIPVLGTLLLLASGENAEIKKIFGSAIPVWIGRRSYAMYLVHWPIISFTGYLLQREMLVTEQLMCFVATIMLSALLYTHVENRLRLPVTYTDHTLSKVRLGSAAAITWIMASAAAISFSGGVPSRIPPAPPQIAEQLAEPGEFHKTNYGGVGTPYVGLWLTPQPADNEKQGPSVVFMGDSHMRHYFTGLKPLLNFGRYEAFAATTSCLSTPGLVRNTPDNDWGELCSTYLELASTFAIENDIDLLILAFSWDSQMRVGIVAQTGESVTFVDLSQSITSLAKIVAPANLLLIGDVPGAGLGDPTACYTRPNIFGFECTSGQGTTLEESAAFRTNKELAKIAANHDQIWFFNPTDVLCSGGWCSALNSEGVIYSDGSHLSKVGSAVMAEPVFEEIERVISLRRDRR